ncbi:hypothetical protein A1O3_02146 [Capronia epimyces CBS 606.96]|uniref:Clr5 domain-containing protein n=1 Tax=Capronia epimyces CBS 606.96 TaxID=1182542 RepID=W9Y8A1_9EURO|nr:uncharacterized protein A1O3_02146 [Capronia epimyces CBS 606.96]EXJ89082.1 hypothetical protein A1O3_02146 [Capronia epimyces CBS 606.96]
MDLFDSPMVVYRDSPNEDNGLPRDAGSGTSDYDELILVPQPQPQPRPSASTDSRTSQSWRLVGPTPQQWTEIKDVFSQLYLVENRKLRDVREILSKKHGFHASEKMYKRRIAEWKIRKNYKAKEKEILATRVKACVDAGRDVQSISYRGRPLKLDRVKRHCRTDKRFAQLWEHMSQSPDAMSVGEIAVPEESPATTSTLASSHHSSTVLDQLDVQSKHQHPMPSSLAPSLTVDISLPTDLHNIQYGLFHAREAVDWQFTAFKPLRSRELQSRFPESIPDGVRAGQTDQASAFWLALYHGRDHLEQGRPGEAWTTLDDCCRMVQPLILSVPLHLLSCLLLHFATPWRGMTELETQLLGFVASMTGQVLGPAHPLAKAMAMLTVAETRHQVVESMMDLVIEGYRSRRKADSSSLFALRVDQIDMLRKRKQYQQAHQLCDQLIQDSRAMRRKRHRTALAALGRIYADQKEEFAVEGVAHRILDHEASDPPSSNSNSNSATTVWACDQLATLCVRRQEYALAESYLRRATWVSYQGRYTHRGPSTRSFLNRLHSCVRHQGREVDIDALCEDMGVQMALVGG